MNFKDFRDDAPPPPPPPPVQGNWYLKKLQSLLSLNNSQTEFSIFKYTLKNAKLGCPLKPHKNTTKYRD